MRSRYLVYVAAIAVALLAVGGLPGLFGGSWKPTGPSLGLIFMAFFLAYGFIKRWPDLLRRGWWLGVGEIAMAALAWLWRDWSTLQCAIVAGAGVLLVASGLRLRQMQLNEDGLAR